MSPRRFVVAFLAFLAFALVPTSAQSLERAEVSRVFEGVVLDPTGGPAVGAVVISSAGGKATTALDGSYRLEVGVPVEVESVQITAVGAGNRSLLASTRVGLAGAGSVLVGTLALASGTCEPGWLPTFEEHPGMNSFVQELLVFDDGGGPALYAGGFFTKAGNLDALRVAKWDGTAWTALGIGPDWHVHALAVFDDGSGPALYAGGEFDFAGGVPASRAARWDGLAWSALGAGLDDKVQAFIVFDDGSGPALYAGGTFTSSGATPVAGIARWDGATWSALGSGTSGGGGVMTLAVFDAGGGEELYAGGNFTGAGGVAGTSSIARWDGASWSALGTGTNGWVRSLAVFDDGSGAALYAGGTFSNASGIAGSNKIARWDGASWSSVGGGQGGTIFELATLDDGSGPALYATANNAFRVTRWNGSTWALVGSTFQGTPLALAVFDDGNGATLYAGGNFSEAGGGGASCIAKLTASDWAPVGKGLNGSVYALTTFDDGSGPAVYVGGYFTFVDGMRVNRIARWDGASWSALGAGMNEHVLSLAVFDDGSGAALYAGGGFTSAGGVPANRLARWDGASWSALGSGITSTTTDIAVHALQVHDDGSGPGPALYAGGYFTHAGGVPVNHVARWDGASWSALAAGRDGVVYALAVFDDGTGPALYAGGHSESLDPLERIGKWDGVSWSPLGLGVFAGSAGSTVAALAAFDDGTGPALYVGGSFDAAGGVATRRIARWDGAVWSPVGSGFTQGSVSALAVFDDGSGPALHAAGYLVGLSRWDGAVWETLGSELITAMATFEGALLVGGLFYASTGSDDAYLARWGGCLDTLAPELDCPGSVVALDKLATAPGENVFFTVTATDNLDPSPDVVCVPPSGSFFPLGTTLVSCTATDALGNESTCQFPVTVQPRVRRP